MLGTYTVFTVCMNAHFGVMVELIMYPNFLCSFQCEGMYGYVPVPDTLRIV